MQTAAHGIISSQNRLAIVPSQDCDVTNFEMNLIFLIKLFILYDQKVKTET